MAKYISINRSSKANGNIFPELAGKTKSYVRIYCDAGNVVSQIARELVGDINKWLETVNANGIRIASEAAEYAQNIIDNAPYHGIRDGKAVRSKNSTKNGEMVYGIKITGSSIPFIEFGTGQFAERDSSGLAAEMGVRAGRGTFSPKGHAEKDYWVFIGADESEADKYGHEIVRKPWLKKTVTFKSSELKSVSSYASKRRYMTYGNPASHPILSASRFMRDAWVKAVGYNPRTEESLLKSVSYPKSKIDRLSGSNFKLTESGSYTRTQRKATYINVRGYSYINRKGTVVNVAPYRRRKSK